MLTHADLEEIKSIVREIITDLTKYLPSKELFLDRMDKLSKEIQEARNEFSAHTKQHEDIHDDQEKNDKRFGRIEKHVGLPPFHD